jgi:hypothetical protein
MNIEYVMHKQQSDQGLYTDSGKRRHFARNFMVPDLTDHLIEMVELCTQTWDGMVDDLRRRLAKRQHHSFEDSKRKAHQAVTEPPETGSTVPDTPSPSPIDHDTTLATILQVLNHTAFINALNSDWRIGYELWGKLPSQLKQQLMNIREEHLPLNSGGVRPNTGGNNLFQNHQKGENSKPNGSTYGTNMIL